jgi:uncharacterized RDD family membrane protein YckC
VENDVIVLSPEKTILSFRLGGFGARACAHILDVIIVIVLLIASALVIFFVFGSVDAPLAGGILLFLTFALPLAYFVLLEGMWNGQTLGKKALNLRVRMADGTPVSFAAALGRNLMRPADMLPGIYFVGLLAMFTNPRAQRLGDLVADTIVCQDRRPVPRFAIAPHSVGLHPLEQHVGDLKGMTIQEYNALRRFADRFPELPPIIQTKLVEEVWEPIAERRDVPKLINVHPIYLAEAVVMKYGRQHGLL